MDTKRDHCSRALYAMMTAHTIDYVALMRISGFWETMGYLVKNGYITIDAITNLFGGAVVEFDDAFRVHLKRRGDEEGVPEGFYEHALYLADEVRRKMGLA